MAAFAEYESDVKADYARANHRMVRAQGRPWGGRPPFGYDHHPTERSYVANEQRAEIVRCVFDLYSNGASRAGSPGSSTYEGICVPAELNGRLNRSGESLTTPPTRLSALLTTS